MKYNIETSRLILREWKESDILPFSILNKDPNVMEYFLKPLSEEESLSFYNRIKEEFQAYEYGLYAVERKDNHSFIGYTGFHKVPSEMDFAPAVEIGWRISFEAWGKGYATEAASACLDYAKKYLDFKEVYSFTSKPNSRSEHVMQKIGMKYIKEFDHPLIKTHHPLCRHVLYKKVF